MHTTIVTTTSTNHVQDEDVVVLGVASVETKGLASIGEMVGGIQTPGISEE